MDKTPPWNPRTGGAPAPQTHHKKVRETATLWQHCTQRARCGERARGDIQTPARWLLLRSPTLVLPHQNHGESLQASPRESCRDREGGGDCSTSPGTWTDQIPACRAQVKVPPRAFAHLQVQEGTVWLGTRGGQVCLIRKLRPRA